MTTKDYFEEKLKVQFTMSELHEIAIALGTEYFKELNANRRRNAEMAWRIREKVRIYIKNNNEIFE